MGLLNIIRRMALREKQSIREISRRTGLSRNTIAKYLNAGTIEPTFTVPERPSAYSNETGQEFRSLTGRLFQRYTGRGSEAKPDGRNVSGSWFINVGVYQLGQA